MFTLLALKLIHIIKFKIIPRADVTGYAYIYISMRYTRQKLKEVVEDTLWYVEYLPQSKKRPFYHTRIVVTPTAILHSILDMVITAILVII